MDKSFFVKIFFKAYQNIQFSLIFWYSGHIPQIYLNGEVILVVDSDKHLGNWISTLITDRNIIDNICDLYQRSNRVISDFRVCHIVVH